MGENAAKAKPLPSALDKADHVIDNGNQETIALTHPFSKPAPPMPATIA